MGKLYFRSSQNQRRLVQSDISKNDAYKYIVDYVRQLNPNFKIYYCRTWQNPDNPHETIYDVGSHTEFFIFQEKD